MFPTELGEFLVPAALAGWFLSLFLEKTRWFQNLEPHQRSMWTKIITWVFGILVSAVPVILSPEQYTQAGEWYKVVVPILNMLFFGGAVSYGISQANHAVNKRVFPQYIIASQKLRKAA